MFLRLKISKDGDVKTLLSYVVVSSLFLHVFFQPQHPVICLRLPVGSRGTSSSHPGSENPSLEGKIHLSAGIPGQKPRSGLRRDR